jgi:hypothetical protein
MENAQPSYSILPVMADYENAGETPILSLNWALPGHGEKYDSCRKINWAYSCESFHNVKYGVQHCDRPECPECVGFWANREAKNATPRLTEAGRLWRNAGRPVGQLKHIVISPPQAWAEVMISNVDDFKRIRTEANKVAKQAGLLGGIMIFHAHRGSKISPHWHFLGYGHIIDQKDFQETFPGWVYKNKGKRKTIKGTIKYLLTHCGIAFWGDIKPFKTVTWIGICAYNKVSAKLIRTKGEPPICEECHKPLHKWAMCNSDYTKDWIDEGELPYETTIKTYYLRHKWLIQSKLS